MTSWREAACGTVTIFQHQILSRSLERVRKVQSAAKAVQVNGVNTKTVSGRPQAQEEGLDAARLGAKERSPPAGGRDPSPCRGCDCFLLVKTVTFKTTHGYSFGSAHSPLSSSSGSEKKMTQFWSVKVSQSWPLPEKFRTDTFLKLVDGTDS